MPPPNRPRNDVISRVVLVTKSRLHRYARCRGNTRPEKGSAFENGYCAFTAQFVIYARAVGVVRCSRNSGTRGMKNSAHYSILPRIFSDEVVGNVPGRG